MLHINPIKENEAKEQISILYKDIKQTFNIEIVPLIFQYVANFEEYFVYLWGKVKANILDPQFQISTKELSSFTNQAIAEIYIPSQRIIEFSEKINPVELEKIEKTVKELEEINAKLMILMIAVRESIKGVLIGVKLLEGKTNVFNYGQDFKDNENIKEQIIEQSLQGTQSNEINEASKMLAPLFGDQSIIVSHYADFFTQIAMEMDGLLKQEGYLAKRVAIEKQALIAVDKFQHALDCSYAEMIKMIKDKPYFDELLYLLSETFPSQFPRLLLTSAVMNCILLENKNLHKNLRVAKWS